MSAIEIVVVPKPTKRGHSRWKEEYDLWNRSRCLATIKKRLVIDVVGSDSQTSASETQLSDDIFGTSGDLHNLRSHCDICSYGETQIEAVIGSPIRNDSVYTVIIPNTINGASDDTISNALVNKATEGLDSLAAIADHVMLCLPPERAVAGLRM